VHSGNPPENSTWRTEGKEKRTIWANVRKCYSCETIKDANAAITLLGKCPEKNQALNALTGFEPTTFALPVIDA